MAKDTLKSLEQGFEKIRDKQDDVIKKYINKLLLNLSEEKLKVITDRIGEELSCRGFSPKIKLFEIEKLANRYSGIESVGITFATDTLYPENGLEKFLIEEYIIKGFGDYNPNSACIEFNMECWFKRIDIDGQDIPMSELKYDDSDDKEPIKFSIKVELLEEESK